MKELVAFDQLSADITQLVAPTLSIVVKDAESGAAAIEAAKDLKALKARVEDQRTELVKPLNDQVKAVNSYAKQITAPLDDAYAHVTGQINAYANEQEKIRRAEEERVERERQAEVKRIADERAKAEKEFAEKMIAEQESKAKAASLFGAENGDVDRMHAELEAKQQREWAEKQAELDRVEAGAHHEHEAKRFDVKGLGVSNARKNWFCEATDLSKVPKEFLIIQLNEKAVIAAAKAGVEIPGVRTWTEMAVAIGRNTSAPRSLIKK